MWILVFICTLHQQTRSPGASLRLCGLRGPLRSWGFSQTTGCTGAVVMQISTCGSLCGSSYRGRILCLHSWSLDHTAPFPPLTQTCACIWSQTFGEAAKLVFGITEFEVGMSGFKSWLCRVTSRRQQHWCKVLGDKDWVPGSCFCPRPDHPAVVIARTASDLEGILSVSLSAL